jgi:acyl dehydratase
VIEPDRHEGWYLEQFRPGDRFRSAGRTITETDLVNYLGLSAFFEEAFMNVPFATGASVYRRRVVPAVLVLAISEGLIVLTGRLERAIAFLGMTELTMKAPVAVGDTIRVGTKICSTRQTSKPGRGIVQLLHTVRIDDDSVVMEYTSTRMVQARPE